MEVAQAVSAHRSPTEIAERTNRVDENLPHGAVTSDSARPWRNLELSFFRPDAEAHAVRLSSRSSKPAGGGQSRHRWVRPPLASAISLSKTHIALSCHRVRNLTRATLPP